MVDGWVVKAACDWRADYQGCEKVKFGFSSGVQASMVVVAERHTSHIHIHNTHNNAHIQCTYNAHTMHTHAHTHNTHIHASHTYTHTNMHTHSTHTYTIHNTYTHATHTHTHTHTHNTHTQYIHA